jgi:hypothetical protein
LAPHQHSDASILPKSDMIRGISRCPLVCRRFTRRQSARSTRLR